MSRDVDTWHDDAPSVGAGTSADDLKPHDFPSMFARLVSKINLKVAVFLFLVGMFILSDMFVMNVLASFSGAVRDDETPTSRGTIIQLVFIVLAYIAIDVLSSTGVL